MPATENDALPIIVLRRFLDRAPVDLDAASRALGATVERRDLGPKVTGSIRRTDGGFAIALNAAENPLRQRFTLAHELAHLVLHGNLIGPGPGPDDGPGGAIVDDTLYYSRLSDGLERQARRFAAGILMPMRLVKEAWHEGPTSAADIAARFDVPVSAAELRLRDLGLTPGRL